MKLPGTNWSNPSVQVLSFGGYDQREKGKGFRFSEMQNLGTDHFPCLAPRAGRRAAARQQDIRLLCAPEYAEGELDSFTGIAGQYFYYKGKKIANQALSADFPKTAADFNGNICIFPDKLYYCYRPDPDTGEITEELQSMEQEMELEQVTLQSEYDEMTGKYSASLEKNGVDFAAVFAAGDSILLSNCQTYPQNDTFLPEKNGGYADADSIVSVVVEKAETGRLTLRMYNKNNQLMQFEDGGGREARLTVRRAVPDLAQLCVHNNRLWGTSPDGKYIYASALGNCFNFYSFQGLESDSWYSEVGTAGVFTGIISYRTSVVAFKREWLHHIYGDMPSNFSMPKQLRGGCADGRSVAELDGVLYYLGAGGFYSYSGGQPQKISDNILTGYTAACGGTDGVRYYTCARRTDGTDEVLVFDPRYDIWHREDTHSFLNFLRYGAALYAADSSTVYRLGADGETVEWSGTTAPITHDSMRRKGIFTLFLRVNMAEDASLTVAVSEDGNPFRTCGVLRGDSLCTRRVPIRLRRCDSYRLRFSGTGQTVIQDLELRLHSGGSTMRQEVTK